MASKKHPLDGYDFTADVPPGTPLLVSDYSGKVWRLAKRGVRYHADCNRLHGAKPARAPAAVAATSRIRKLAEEILKCGTYNPSPAEIKYTWTDAPSYSGSMASTLSLTVTEAGYATARLPVYDDAPRVASRQLTPAEFKKLAADLEKAPKAVRLQEVSIRERTVTIEKDDPRLEVAKTLPGARPFISHQVFASQDGYAEALTTPGARLAFMGGPVTVPDPNTSWDVPVTVWRAHQETLNETKEKTQ